MTHLEPLFTYAEAAAELQVTPEDCADPARWVYEKVRALELELVRCGRTPKLPLRSVQALRELITCRYTSGKEQTVDLHTSMSEARSLSGGTVANARKPSSRKALERLTAPKQKPSSRKSQRATNAATSKTGTRPPLSVIS